MKFDTAAIHIGQEPDRETGAVIPPVYLTSTFAQLEPGKTRGYDYTRSGNPAFDRLGATLAHLEQAEYATVFGSGMAAVNAVISTLSSGDHIVAEENIYGCTYRIYDQVFKKFGITISYVDLSDPANYPEIGKQKPALVWIESPTNPMLKIIDIEAVANAAHEAGTELLVDNTFASPFFQNPLALGADISLSSTTKYINGHSDCLGGVVCTNSEDWNEKMIFAQKAVGLNPSPFDCWLISRGLKTLAVRMKQHQENALKITDFLQSLEETDAVRYPFHPSHPQYELARKQMRGGSGIVTAIFNLPFEQVVKLISNLNLFSLAESLGGIESLICHPASMTHASIPKAEREAVGITDGLVRFSVGIEDADDLIEDIQTALKNL
ncbi:trans-sulfuration enzyme family protein [Pontiella agarivorans]|uniref:PLP-dependent aspartate aminotransferase family protein n=1 Tax=Pontiella agarivorans TaxID=3038953 RepID=A0ABU5MXU1_9BACT|nr:PLP-dependent aspartate aminotransferase family protein [Pontiella agarivorans]MDZ8118982.1 PLP-dependent aspartate aminotransferase family protein [Pontiella agarivorans]